MGRLVAIDPGSHLIGIALWNGTHFMESAHLKAPPRDEFDQRLIRLVGLVEAQLRYWRNEAPLDVIVIERPWMGRNPATAIRLGEVLGALKVLAVKCAPQVGTIAAKSWQMELLPITAKSKRAECEKFAIQAAQQWKPSLRQPDEADAICIGRCVSARLAMTNNDLQAALTWASDRRTRKRRLRSAA